MENIETLGNKRLLMVFERLLWLETWLSLLPPRTYSECLSLKHPSCVDRKQGLPHPVCVAWGAFIRAASIATEGEH